MKEFLDYVVKNKYIIICITVVVVLYALGVVQFLTNAVILLALIALAVFVGKKLQDSEGSLKNLFNFKKHINYKDVYYYQDSNKKNDK